MRKKYTKILLLSSAFILTLIALIMTYYLPTTHKKSQPQTHILGTTTKPLTPTPSPLITITPIASPTATPIITRSPIAIGIWQQGFWDTSTNSLHADVITTLEQQLGKRFAIAHYYRGWEALSHPSLLAEFVSISSSGWRPMLSANPYFFDGCKNEGKPLYKAIAEGNCDEFLKSAGRNLKQASTPFFLRFAWEMNASSMEWEIKKTGSSSEDFIGAWRRMHDIFASEGVTQALWVFSPNVEGSPTFSQYYPGDGYVDWLGLDGYNWGTTQSWSSWQTFDGVFASSYTALSRLSQKPIMVAEVNTADVGGKKAAWLTDMLGNALVHRYPRIRAIVFYNEDRSGTEKVNWRIEQSPAYIEAVRTTIRLPFYSSSL